MTNDLTIEQAVGELKAMKEHIEPHNGDIMSFGENLKKIRKEKNITLKDLAEKLEVTSPNISQYEHDKRNPSLKMILKFAAALNCSIEELIPDTSTPKYTDEEIDKIQAMEQAYVDKMVELAVEESKQKWLNSFDTNSATKCFEAVNILKAREKE